MLSVAGVGPGNPKYLTMDVLERIMTAKTIVSFGRVADTLKDIRDDIIQVNKVVDLVDMINNKEDLLLLASGDPDFYGIVDYLKSKDLKIKEVLPGLSSFQYLMAKLQKPWQDAFFLSLHGREGNLEDLKDKKLSILLIDKDNRPDKISRNLEKLDIKGKIHVGYNLSYPDEKIISKNIGDRIEEYSSLGVVVIENEMD